MSERRGGMRHRRPRLTRSADFDRVYRRGRSAATRSFVLYAFPSAHGDDEERDATPSRRCGWAFRSAAGWAARSSATG